MSLRKRIETLWEKYENLNLKIVVSLLVLQWLHLYWLTTDVVLRRIFGHTFFAFPQTFLPVFVAIDYLEIPTLALGLAYYGFTLVYGGGTLRNTMFFCFMILQVYHVFWLTDEVVYGTLFGSEFLVIPFSAAWIAILIDYLEIPVAIDLMSRILKGNTTR